MYCTRLHVQSVLSLKQGACREEQSHNTYISLLGAKYIHVEYIQSQFQISISNGWKQTALQCTYMYVYNRNHDLDQQQVLTVMKMYTYAFPIHHIEFVKTLKYQRLTISCMSQWWCAIKCISYKQDHLTKNATVPVLSVRISHYSHHQWRQPNIPGDVGVAAANACASAIVCCTSWYHAVTSTWSRE